MSEPVIEKNVPLPPRASFQFLKKMAIGDSVYLPFDSGSLQNLRNAVYNSARRQGLKVAIRCQKENPWEEIVGIRVWRIE